MITSTYNRGGAERQIVATAKGLLERGWDVRIMALGSLQRAEPSIEDELRKLGITPHLPSDFDPEKADSVGPSGWMHVTQLSDLSPLFRFRMGPVQAAIRHYRPTVVHGWLDVPGVLSALAACELGVPRIVVGQRNCQEAMASLAYSAEDLHSLWQAYRSASSNPTVTILNNTVGGAAGYERWLRLPRGTIRVLYNGYMPEYVRNPAPTQVAHFRSTLGFHPGMQVVGTIMRFVRNKDPILWLDTAAEIAKVRPNVRFLVAGYGEMKDLIAARVEALGLGDRLVLPGPVTDVGLVYGAIDIVLMTSSWEGLPNVLLEAQAAGRPVVVGSFSTANEAVLHGRTGIIVPVRSAKRLAEATIAMLENSVWTARAQTEGPKFVASRFGFERMISETIGLYRSIRESKLA
jgi:glycosyltransferase involved in cell wall biosynthesis